MNYIPKLNLITSILLMSLLITGLSGCSKIIKKDMDPNRPLTAEEKRRQNINEGRGVGLGAMIGRNRNTNYEFSTSNPMWRASLEVLDFMPLNTVDYSGGMIITDWYSDNNNENESLKITVRFLSNEVRSDSIKIIIHKKNCKTINNCIVNLAPDSSIIKKEILSVILKKAALFEKESKNPKKDKKK
jgi:hypothetical protein